MALMAAGHEAWTRPVTNHGSDLDANDVGSFRGINGGVRTNGTRLCLELVNGGLAQQDLRSTEFCDSEAPLLLSAQKVLGLIMGVAGEVVHSQALRQDWTSSWRTASRYPTLPGDLAEQPNHEVKDEAPAWRGQYATGRASSSTSAVREPEQEMGPSRRRTSAAAATTAPVWSTCPPRMTQLQTAIRRSVSPLDGTPRVRSRSPRGLMDRGPAPELGSQVEGASLSQGVRRGEARDRWSRTHKALSRNMAACYGCRRRACVLVARLLLALPEVLLVEVAGSGCG